MLETVLLFLLGLPDLSCELIQCAIPGRKEQRGHGHTQHDQAPERQEANGLAPHKQSGQQTHHPDETADAKHVRLIGRQPSNTGSERTELRTSDLCPIGYRLL